jgi:nicotinamidase-related amidase
MKNNIPFLLTIACLTATVWTASAEAKPRSVRPMKPALIVIDAQKAFAPYMAEHDKQMAPLMINAVIELFRERNLPVIRVYHTDPESGPKPDDPGFQYLETLQVKDSDPQIIKNFPSSFKQTGLERLLNGKDRNTLFLCGFSATGCVIATFYGAKDLDYDVFMVKDALISSDAGRTDMVEEICDTVNYNVLKIMLDNAR